jgi:hypothetical protein
MPIDPRFLSMMPSVLKVYKRSARNKYGEPSFSSTPVEYRCRVMDEDRLTRTAENTDAVVAGKVIIFGVADITLDDKVELPDGSEPVIVAVDQHTDEDGPHHTTISVGR